MIQDMIFYMYLHYWESEISARRSSSHVRFFNINMTWHTNTIKIQTFVRRYYSTERSTYDGHLGLFRLRWKYACMHIDNGGYMMFVRHSVPSTVPFYSTMVPWRYACTIRTHTCDNSVRVYLKKNNSYSIIHNFIYLVVHIILIHTHILSSPHQPSIHRHHHHHHHAAMYR